MITSGSSSELATGVVDGPRRTEMRACWQSQTLRSSVRRYILTLVYSGVRRRRGGSSTARGATSGNLGALEEEGRGGGVRGDLGHEWGPAAADGRGNSRAPYTRPHHKGADFWGLFTETCNFGGMKTAKRRGNICGHTRPQHKGQGCRSCRFLTLGERTTY